MKTSAMIVVDPQRDFCEGGALPVEGGNEVCIAIANYLRNRSFKEFQYIVATKDFHLAGDTNGGHFSDKPDFVSTWPPHCVQGTEGSMFHPEVADAGWLNLDAVFYKGQGRPDYSGFQGKAPTIYEDIYLLDWLNRRHVTDVTVVGLATDYCVWATAIDAVTNGFKVRIPQSLTAAVGGPEARDETIRQVAAFQGFDPAHIN